MLASIGFMLSTSTGWTKLPIGLATARANRRRRMQASRPQ
jgi:hypothetical protein